MNRGRTRVRMTMTRWVTGLAGWGTFIRETEGRSRQGGCVGRVQPLHVVGADGEAGMESWGERPRKCVGMLSFIRQTGMGWIPSCCGWWMAWVGNQTRDHGHGLDIANADLTFTQFLETQHRRKGQQGDSKRQGQG
ncbi:hypothetical protein B0T18DRAFT_231196 [Schizothecium vesticola]|uniref:Uncharacterized protein n=1 Tax=Schizothecium vesticola TaxID=314040 RepID=A0AA40K0I2_9PEZI|nr:hypothetical protein B0T18DRAFT_231196 [Schizothecium vesticola]